MKAVADTLAVARSNLIERASRRAKSRRPYRKAGDDELLALIRRLVDERPTYGYRRIRRLINRQRKANGIGHAPTRRGTIFIFAANFYPIEGGDFAGGASRWATILRRATSGAPQLAFRAPA